jgi:plastocyanin
MTRIAVVALLAALAAPAHAAAPARLGIVAKEFRFSLSRPTVKAGRVIVELDNFGEDPHDLHLQRIGGRRVYDLPATGPGRRAELDARLAPGRYRLWCSLADHRARGMRALLRVR